MTVCPCVGPCNAWWRALTEDQQAASEHQPRPGEPTWCPACAARIRRLLAEIPDLTAILEAQITGYHEQTLDHTQRNGHIPSPSVTADDLDEVDDELVGHEMAYRADFNRRNPDRMMAPSPPRRGVLATVTDTTVWWLTRHLDDILAAGMGGHFGEEIARLHRELVSKARAGTGRHRKPVPCPRCGLRLLTWAEGDDHVACSGCGRLLSMGEYQAEVTKAGRQLERAG